MRIAEWLQKAEQELMRAGIATARLDSLVLLEDAAGKDRSLLLAHPEHELSSSQIIQLHELITRRASHEPLAYLRGRTEFYGRTFLLTPGVLEPRPESETMIDLLKQLPIFSSPETSKSPIKFVHKGGHDHKPSQPFQTFKQQTEDTANSTPQIQIADVGTGSGALGITAAIELPGTSVDLIDLYEQPLKLAKSNVDLFTLSLNVIRSDLLASATVPYDVLLCNLPYVPDSFKINQAARHEPREAIFAGSDGLELYRKLFEQIMNMEIWPLYILSEALPPQHDQLRRIAESAGYTLVKTADFIQVYTPSDS
jgi:release factor glutamine methyltransferase